ncbi:MAG: squalene/phytoene synthase family protein [Planctomycetes bacterium]|nr:squalene/phytoene synthase family protein [Planctomycetota bacterium]
MLTPQPKRAALYAVYAWMRCADDLADDSPGPITGGLRLDAFEQQTAATLDAAGTLVDTDALWPSVQQTMREYPIQRVWLDEALAGLRADQGGTTIHTRGDLDRYCHEVAGTVGMICTAIWRSDVPRHEGEWPRALEFARVRGLAFQLTNILRDVRADAELRPARSYLPLDSYVEFGLTLQDLLAWRDERKCAALMGYWVQEARRLYDATAELELLIPAECRRSLVTMTRLYRTLLEQIGEEPRSVVSPERVRVATWRKLSILMSSMRTPQSVKSPTHATA